MQAHRITAVDHPGPLVRGSYAIGRRLFGDVPTPQKLMAHRPALMLGMGAADSDAVVPGDVHLPHEVSALLTDIPIGSDERMLELLEPFRPHRFRVVRVMMGLGRRRL